MNAVDRSEAPASHKGSVVLVAVDESSAAAGVVQQALWLAMAMGAALHVVRVIEVVPTIALGGSSLLIPSAARLVQQAWLDLERLTPCDEPSQVAIKGHVAVGAPSHEIVRLASELGADLLVVGTHEPSKLASALFGSVAMELVRRAPCPVFVVRPKRCPRTDDLPRLPDELSSPVISGPGDASVVGR